MSVQEQYSMGRKYQGDKRLQITPPLRAWLPEGERPTLKGLLKKTPLVGIDHRRHSGESRNPF